MTDGYDTLFVLTLAGAFVAGAALGFVYLWGLWYTVRRQATVENPALWLLLSVVGRLALLLGGFYLIMNGSWQRLLACTAGFVVVRLIMTRRLGPRAALRPPAAAKEPAP